MRRQTPLVSVRRAVLLVMWLSACGKGGMPTRADLPDLLAEAAPSDAAPIATGSPARKAVRDTLRQVLATEKIRGEDVAYLYGRPELRDPYMLMDMHFVGGTYPLGAAELLRKVHALESQVLAEHQGFPQRLEENLAKADVAAEDRKALVDEMKEALAAKRRPVLTAIESHQKLLEALAELFELAGSRPESLKAMRDGLEISDPSLLENFNSKADAVNRAIDATNGVLNGLDADSRRSVHWINLPNKRSSEAKAPRPRPFR